MQSKCGAVFMGELMSPEEIQEASLNHAALPNEVKKSWCLCGDVTEEFWDAMYAHPDLNRAYRLSAFATPDNNAYVLFTIQVMDLQSRFLLALSDPKVRRFINDAKGTGIWLSLGRNDGDAAILTKFLVHADHLSPIAALPSRGDLLPLEEAFLEFAMAARVAQKPETIPSVLKGFGVREVSLNVIKTYTA